MAYSISPRVIAVGGQLHCEVVQRGLTTTLALVSEHSPHLDFSSAYKQSILHTVDLTVAVLLPL